jgi:AraC-like DNA-binding protein
MGQVLLIKIPGARLSGEIPGDLRTKYLIPGAEYSYHTDDNGSKFFCEELSVGEYYVWLEYSNIIKATTVRIKSSRTVSGLYYLLKGKICWKPRDDNLLVSTGNYQYYSLKKQEWQEIGMEPGIHVLFHFSMLHWQAKDMAEAYPHLLDPLQRKIPIVLPLLNMGSKMRKTVAAILGCREKQQIIRNAAISRGLTDLYLWHLKVMVNNQNPRQPEERPRFSVEDLDQYIEGRMAFADVIPKIPNPLLLSPIAKRYGLLPSQFSRLFIQYQHIPLNKYVLQYRMKRAMQMVKEHKLPITEIAIRTGYSSLSNFSKAFKKYHGEYPGYYRKSSEKDYK